jgi:hypothetical protein
MADVGTSANVTTLKRPKADKTAKAAKPSSSAPPLGKFLASSECTRESGGVAGW